MKLVYFLFWFLLAVLADILSLVPYLGAVFSLPFSTIFGIYKWYAGISFAKTGWVTLGDFVAEAAFSTIPANTLDVIMTFMISVADGNEVF